MRNRIKGYSLIQVLISIGILSFISTGVLQMTSLIQNGINVLQSTQIGTQANESVLEQCRIELKNNADYFPDGMETTKTVFVANNEVQVKCVIISGLITGERNSILHQVILTSELENGRFTELIGWVYDEN